MRRYTLLCVQLWTSVSNAFSSHLTTFGDSDIHGQKMLILLIVAIQIVQLWRGLWMDSVARKYMYVFAQLHKLARISRIVNFACSKFWSIILSNNEKQRRWSDHAGAQMVCFLVVHKSLKTVFYCRGSNYPQYSINLYCTLQKFLKLFHFA